MVAAYEGFLSVECGHVGALESILSAVSAETFPGLLCSKASFKGDAPRKHFFLGYETLVIDEVFNADSEYVLSFYVALFV